MKRRIGFGSGLGDFLRSRRAEIATAQAGADGDAQAVAAGLAEELAAACGLNVDQYLAVESGETDPPAEQLAALAEALGKHGVTVTADDLAALDEQPADDDADADDADEESEGGASESLRALEAAQHESAQLRALASASDAMVAQLRAQVDAHLAALATARGELAASQAMAAVGEARLAERRADLARRLAVRHGGAERVPERLRLRAESASLDDVADMECLLGADPMVDAMCVECGARAETLLRSSRPAVDAQGRPAVTRTPRDPSATPTADDVMDAATSLMAKRKAEGKPLSKADAVREVKAMSASELFLLVDELPSAN